jgi:carbon monoxide dehydrogenase subunit G
MAMQMTGEVVLPASRTSVWIGLTDPEILRECVPGCESFERTDQYAYAAVALAKIGPLKARFKGNITLCDLDPPNTYRIEGQGDGGIAGFAKGGANVVLSDTEDGNTLLSYEVDADIGGKLATLGQMLVNSVAKNMADEFFRNFARKLTED